MSFAKFPDLATHQYLTNGENEMRTLLTALVLFVASISLATAQDRTDQGTGTTVTPAPGPGPGPVTSTPAGRNTAADDNRDDGFDPGWIGLLGLAGLAGLIPRNRDRDRDDHRHAGTVNR